MNYVASLAPRRAQIFTDSGSWGHLGWGVLTGVLPPHAAVGSLAIFTGYQLSEGQQEPWARTGGEFFELALGIFIGSMIRGLAR
jgi:hypothetical protein